jgi:VCBS repeat-containing protein
MAMSRSSVLKKVLLTGLIPIGVAGALVAVPTGAVQPPTATVTPLETLVGCNPVGGQANFVHAINAAGVSVGRVEGCYPNYLIGIIYASALAVSFNPTVPVHINWNPPYDFAGDAHGINDAGVISGGGTGGVYAFPTWGWLPPLPGAANQFGGYINNAGEVVATTFFDSLNRTPGHATLWVDGVAIDLGTFGGNTISPRALAPNLSGANRIIVGYYEQGLGGPAAALKWQDGVWSELPGPPNCDFRISSAADVSDDGIIVGSEGYCLGTGVIWENGQIRHLKAECELAAGPVIGTPSHFFGIARTPGGRHLIAGTCNGQPAVYYDDGAGNYTCHLLPLLPGDTGGSAVDVNPSGQLVGSSTQSGQSHPVRWDFTLPNSPPIAQAASLSTNEDAQANGTLNASDADGASLTYRIVTSATIGTAALTNPATGAFTYTPNPNVSGSDTFTFVANDGLADSNVATVDVTIAPVNDAPVAADGTALTTPGASVDGTLAASDIDSAPLTYSIVGPPSKGTVVLTSATTGAYTYTAGTGATGIDTFTFKANDGALDSNTATITVTIEGSGNAPPAASQGTLTTTEDTPARGTLSATDPEEQPLIFSLVTNGSKGTATITNTATGRYRYVPRRNENGSDSFTFKANDGTSDSNVAVVTVTISPVNDHPEAQGGSFVTSMNQPVSGTLQATDVDGDSLTFALAGAPQHGQVAVAGSGAFTYTPDPGFTGRDSFTFQVTDGSGASASATVRIRVRP